MLDIKKAQEKAKVEDQGVAVHLEDLEGSLIYYQDENGEEKPVTITIAGQHSTLHRDIERRQQKRRLSKKDLTGARARQDLIERVAHCTLGWQGITSDGEPVAFTRDMARQIYEMLPWILDQVVEAMQDHSRFFNKESNN